MNAKFRPDQARFPSTKPKGARVRLAPDHPAVAEGRSIFPSTVLHAIDVQRILKSGKNSPKTGAKIEKGAWTGFPIFTLTLEERETCSRECKTWATCYGNNMRYAERIMQDPVFERRLLDEICALAEKHTNFVVRLHILGDFYSVDYVELWKIAMTLYPGLRIFGYTGRPIDTDIGTAIMELNLQYPERCRIRYSGTDAGGFGSMVIQSEAESRHVICPAQLDKTACCATCAFCWTSNQTVEFLEH